MERPVVGTTCCASTAEAIVVQEMSLLPGVEDVAVDCAAGTVEVAYQPANVSEGEIAAALAEIGYPPQSS
jgi:copper chaperone CopZ